MNVIVVKEAKNKEIVLKLNFGKRVMIKKLKDNLDYRKCKVLVAVLVIGIFLAFTKAWLMGICLVIIVINFLLKSYIELKEIIKSR